MIPLSRRHSGAALALITSALLAVGWHRAFAANLDPCADPEQLLRLAAYGSDYEVDVDHLGPGDRTPQQRVDGKLPPAVAGERPLAFRVARAAEPYPIYSRSFLVVPLLPEDRTELRELRVGSDVLPVYRVTDDSLGVIRFTRYLLIQGVDPVARLLPSGIASAWPQLVHGTLPVTAFVVSGAAKPEAFAEMEGAAEAWLAAVWTEFRSACGH